MRARAAMLVAATLAAGCGGGDERAEPTPTATPTATPTTTPTASPTAFAPSAPEPPEDLPEAQPGGAGDEEPARFRTELRIGASGIYPDKVAVRGFFALEFRIRNDTARPRRVAFAGERIRVPAGATRSLRSPGVRPGPHVLRAGAAGTVEVLAAPPGEP